MNNLSEIKISRVENTLLNIFSPIDCVVNLFWEGTYMGGAPIRCSPFESKREDYRRLISSLTTQGYNEKIGEKYANSVCGRIQLRLAKQRGLISEEEYRNLFL